MKPCVTSDHGSRFLSGTLLLEYSLVRMSAENDTQAGIPDDSLWTEFDSIEARRKAETEAAYRAIEGYNDTLLNRVAGISDAAYNLVSPLGGVSEDHASGDAFHPDVDNELLFLRPDTTEKALAEGGSPQDVYMKGNPYVVVGDVPPETEQLIDKLLRNT